MKIVEAIFEKIKIFFFLCELPLILRIDWKQRARDICKGALDIEL